MPSQPVWSDHDSGLQMTPLAWSLWASPAGYQRAGKLQEAQIMLKWGADHLLNCWNSQVIPSLEEAVPMNLAGMRIHGMAQ